MRGLFRWIKAMWVNSHCADQVLDGIVFKNMFILKYEFKTKCPFNFQVRQPLIKRPNGHVPTQFMIIRGCQYCFQDSRWFDTCEWVRCSFMDVIIQGCLFFENGFLSTVFPKTCSSSASTISIKSPIHHSVWKECLCFSSFFSQPSSVWKYTWHNKQHWAAKWPHQTNIINIDGGGGGVGT